MKSEIFHKLLSNFTRSLPILFHFIFPTRMMSASKGAFGNICWQTAQKSTCCRLRRMDFLNVPANIYHVTRPPSMRHPNAVRAFRDIHVSKSLCKMRNIRKSHPTPQGQHCALFVQPASFYFELPLLTPTS